MLHPSFTCAGGAASRRTGRGRGRRPGQRGRSRCGPEILAGGEPAEQGGEPRRPRTARPPRWRYRGVRSGRPGQRHLTMVTLCLRGHCLQAGPTRRTAGPGRYEGVASLSEEQLPRPLRADVQDAVLQDQGRQLGCPAVVRARPFGLEPAVITSKRDRAAPPADIAGARFNDYFPLLMLNRPAQAAHLLRAQPSPASSRHSPGARQRAFSRALFPGWRYCLA